MPHKTNNYIGADKAETLAKENTYFQRSFPNKGGYFVVNREVLKINEKVFKLIQQHLKPRSQ